MIFALSELVYMELNGLLTAIIEKMNWRSDEISKRIASFIQCSIFHNILLRITNIVMFIVHCY